MRGTGSRILMVGLHSGDAAMSDLLRGGGCEVTQVDSAEEGLRLARANKPDLILGRGILPGQAGDLFLRQWRSDPALSGIPVLFIDGFADPASLLEEVFTILQPDAPRREVAVAVDTRPAPMPAVIPDMGLPTILIIEDNARDIELLTSALDEARILNPRRLVRSGVAAISYLSGEGEYSNRARYPLPGLILLDLAMPVVDGFQVLQWIRARCEFDDVPVVVLTGFASDPLIARAHKAGADSYLIKGSDTEGLLELLKNPFLGWALVPIPEKHENAE